MKKINYIIVIALLSVISCTQKDKYDDYRLFIKNNSSQELNIITYNNSIETNNINILSAERGLECSYNSTLFFGYSTCRIDSIKIIFPNNKGYICAGLNDDSFCFGNQITPLTLGEKFEQSNNNVYTFNITEEDYDNALDIPE